MQSQDSQNQCAQSRKLRRLDKPVSEIVVSNMQGRTMRVTAEIKIVNGYFRGYLAEFLASQPVVCAFFFRSA